VAHVDEAQEVFGGVLERFLAERTGCPRGCLLPEEAQGALGGGRDVGAPGAIR
jgi:hypothetical protein